MNWASILKQAEAAMNTPQRKAESKNIANKYIISGGTLGNGKALKPISQAGEKFIEVLKSKIQEHAGSDYSSGELGDTAVSAARNLTASTPYQDGNVFIIDINFEGNLYRSSLAPDKYGGVDNIVALLNNGYDAGKYVYGIWKGHEGLYTEETIRSLPHRAGAHFIQEAVEEFNSTYGAEYGVMKIIISDKYE